jgi:hypothetical protein
MPAINGLLFVILHLGAFSAEWLLFLFDALFKFGHWLINFGYSYINLERTRFARELLHVAKYLRQNCLIRSRSIHTQSVHVFMITVCKTQILGLPLFVIKAEGKSRSGNKKVVVSTKDFYIPTPHLLQCFDRLFIFRRTCRDGEMHRLFCSAIKLSGNH